MIGGNPDLFFRAEAGARDIFAAISLLNELALRLFHSR